MEVIPDYEDFDDLEESNNSTVRSSPMDPGSILKFINGVVNIVALMTSLNNRKPARGKPRGNLASDVNSLQETGKYYHAAQDRFHPDTASKKFKMQSDKLSNEIDQGYQPMKGTKMSNAIDQQYQPVDTYPPYNPFSGTNAESYGNENPKTSYDSDMDQYKTSKKQMNYLGQNVEVQPSYSYEVPYQPSKMASSMDATDDSNNDDQYPYQYQYPSYKPSDVPDDDDDDDDDITDSIKMKPKQKQKLPVYESWMDHIEHPPKPKPPMPADDGDDDAMYVDPDSYKPMKKPKKSKKPMYVPPPDDDDVDDESDDQSRHPWKNQIPDDDSPVYHHDFHHDDKKPINYHDFDLEYHHPPEEDHKMEEDRESKRPYSYYFLGRKLWYVPLIFSVYFIIYIGGLVLKSLARHKIQFPEKLWEVHDDHHHPPADHHRRNRRIDFVTNDVVNAIEKVKNKFM